MMSGSEESYLSSSSDSLTEATSDSEEDFGVTDRPVQPYQFEPLAPEGYVEEPEDEEDEDAMLESRFEQEITVAVW